MEILLYFIDYIVHIDTHLNTIIQHYDTWTYAILFMIIFLETGVVLAPFLPGDSLIFAVAAISARGALNPIVIFALLSFAAIFGDAINYWIGRRSSSWIFKKESRWLNETYLEKTKRFYEIHGKKTIVIARFIPIIRTFAPFVAGIGKMNYREFTIYNSIGGIFWVGLFTFGGYFFGNAPIVRENFSLAILLIILASLTPTVIEFIKHVIDRVKRRQTV